MTDHELDARFEEAAKLLTGAAWGREPLFTLAQAVAKARERNEPDREALRALRDHIRGRAAEIRGQLDQLLEEVPCTIHARILYVELLTGCPGLPGTPANNGERASELVNAIQVHLTHPWEDQRQQYDQLLKAEGPQAALAFEQDMQRWNHFRKEAAWRDLTVEALRIFQQLQEGGERWMKRPRTGSTFAHYFSAEQWTKVERAMEAAGISPKEGKGKMDQVAAVHAAFNHFRVRIPTSGQWLELLRNTYPSVTWSDKCTPRERDGYRGDSYKLAYQATLDRLG
jgi:hypothetical protein